MYSSMTCETSPAAKLSTRSVARSAASSYDGFELNAFEPVIFHCLFESLDTLTNCVEGFIDYCITGITANEDACKASVENSIGIVTSLCPYIGYTDSARIAKRALKEGRKVYDVILEENIMPKEEVDKIFEQVINEVIG